MTIEQAQTARPTRDVDTRYGKGHRAWTTSMFVAAIYENLTKWLSR
jgi:hypothetical protein